MILQLRRYLYGNLTESKLAQFRDGRAKRIHYPGVMSFFPLVDDLKQLKALDGWLLHTVQTSLAQRTALWHAAGVGSLPTPHGLGGPALLRAKARTSAGQPLDLRLPSFVRIGTVINRAAVAHGPNAVGRGGGPQHYSYP